MNFFPAAPASLLRPLEPVFEALGRPAPVRVQALRRPGALGSYLVTDATGGRTRLTAVLTDLVGTGVFGALVAARRLEGDEGLPVAEPTIALPLAALGCPAILHAMPSGRPADAIGDPELALRALGRVLDQVGRHPQPDGGALANAHRFYPSHASWGETWAALARRWAEIARRGGVALRPMTEALLSRIDPSLLAFDGPPVLVPGGLAPGALWLDEGGALTAVDGWIPAWSGDPWSAWAPLLHLPASALATIRAAHASPPRLAAQADRLAAYAAGHALYILAEAASAPGPHERVEAMQRALLAVDALPGLPARLLAADEGRETPGPVGTERLTVLALMDRMVREPALTDLSGWMAAAGAALLAHHVGGVAELAGWREVARASVSRLEPGLGPAPLPADEDSRPASDNTQGWILRWLASELREAAGGHAPEGFDAMIARLSRRPPPSEGAASAPARLLEAVLGLAAVARVRGGDHAETRDRLVSQARESWGALDFGVPAPEHRPQRYLRRYADPDAHANLAWPVGLLLFAFARAGDLPLPAPVPAILRALGVEA